MPTFEDRLMDLIAEYVAGPESLDEVISVLELRLMALREEAEEYE